MLAGIVAALLAALAWSLNFVVPFVIGGYSVFDFSLFRFMISGLLGLCLLASDLKAVRALRFSDYLMAFFLGVIGYLGYFLTVVGAAIFAGPVIAPAILGLVPVVLALSGNLRQRTVPWGNLMLPLSLSAVGSTIVNLGGFNPRSTRSATVVLGILLALAAVSLWTWFGLLNQSALAKRSQIGARVWTALIMVGAGFGMLAFLPFGLVLDVFEIPRLGPSWRVAEPLYIWGTSLAVVSSVGGALAWTYAAQRLPVALSAQLITMETLFGTIFGLWVRHRWPTLAETFGMALLLMGVLAVIRLVYGQDALELDRRSG
jgi:drug/metabolite transporter (DMT)-like permease